MKTLILSGTIFEDTELLQLLSHLQGSGFCVDIASHARGKIRGLQDGKILVGKTFAEVDQTDYTVLILPGGNASVTIRNVPKIQEITRDFFGEPGQCQPSITAGRR